MKVTAKTKFWLNFYGYMFYGCAAGALIRIVWIMVERQTDIIWYFLLGLVLSACAIGVLGNRQDE